MTKKLLGSLSFYLIFILLYTLFSFSLTHPSLVLSSHQVFWQYQLWLRATFYDQRLLMGITYFILVSGLWLGFYLTYRQIKTLKLSIKKILFLFACISLPLIFSFHSLSSDLFNYIFNAKMVLVYHQNPHLIQPAQVSDPWHDFMHNTEGLAPYGYGWTGISLPLYLLSGGKLTLALFVFKTFNWGVCLVLIYLVFLCQKQKNLTVLWLFFANPWFLLEFVSNAHNDVWMMFLTLTACYYLSRYQLKNLVMSQKIKFASLSILMLVLSISIKYVTVLLLPLMVSLIILPTITSLCCDKKPRLAQISQKIWAHLTFYLYDYSLVLFFLPLFSARSWQFHPWYLLWALVFAPLVKLRFLSYLAFFFALTSTYRYLPYMLHPEYDALVLNGQKIITWSALILWSGYVIIRQLRKKQFNNTHEKD